MIRIPSRQGARRLVCGSLVAASAFAVGIGVAVPAGAASTALKATPTKTSYGTGTQATVNVTSEGTPTTSPLLFDITAGPDMTAADAKGTACSADADSATSFTCAFTNGGTAGQDTFRVYDDVDKSGTFTEGDVFTTATVTFNPAYDKLDLTCINQALDGDGQANQPSGDCQVKAGTATEDLTATVTKNATSSDGNPTPVAGVAVNFLANNGTTLAAPGATPNEDGSITVTTGSNGKATVTATPKSTDNGTFYSTVATADANSASSEGAGRDVAYVTYSAPAQSKVVISPTTQSQTSGTSATVKATYTDQYGQPYAGGSGIFTVSGRNSVGLTPRQADENGVSTFTYTDQGSKTTSGTDTVSLSSSGTYNATVNWTAVPPGPAANVTVTGLTSVVVRNLETATATVTDSDGRPIPGQSVNFSTEGAQNSTGTATTNADGKATFTFRTQHAGYIQVTASASEISGSNSVLIKRQPTTFQVDAYSSSKGRVTIVALASPVTQVTADATVHFYYQTSKGYGGPIPVKIVIDSKGRARAQVDISRPSGSTQTFYATIEDNGDVSAQPSRLFSTRVK